MAMCLLTGQWCRIVMDRSVIMVREVMVKIRIITIAVMVMAGLKAITMDASTREAGINENA